MRHSLLFFLISMAAVGAPDLAQAQPLPVDSVRASYERLEYEKTVQRAQHVLDHYKKYKPEQLGKVHVIMGALRFSQGNQSAARRQFEDALSLQPELELSALRFSPKIVTFFQRIKGQVQQETSKDSAALGKESIRYIIKDSPRPQAALRSAVLPGAGQIYKGETVEGWTLALLWGSTLVSTDLIDRVRQRAKKEYLDAERGNTQGPYEVYNTWHKAAEGLRLAAAVLWGYAVLDALLDHQFPAQAQSSRWRIRSTVSGGAGVHVQVQF